jgi:hypothetical protein
MIAIDIVLKFLISMIAAIFLIYSFINIKSAAENYFSTFEVSKSNYEIRILNVEKIDEESAKAISETCIDILNITKKSACYYLKSSNGFNIVARGYEGEYKNQRYKFDAKNFDEKKQNGLIIIEKGEGEIKYFVRLIN